MENQDTFGLTLRQLRKNKGLSQGNVAKKLGYTSPQFVSNWERDLSMPPLETLPVLCKLYGIKPFSMREFLLDHYEDKLSEAGL